MTTVALAKMHQLEVLDAIRTLNRAVQDAAVVGILVRYETTPRQTIGHPAYDVLQAAVTIDPSKLEQ